MSPHQAGTPLQLLFRLGVTLIKTLVREVPSTPKRDANMKRNSTFSLSTVRFKEQEEQ